MNKRIVTRRDFIRLIGLGAAGALASCATPTPTPQPAAPQVITQQVEVTRIVAGTPQVETQQVVITATPAPTAAPAAV